MWGGRYERGALEGQEGADYSILGRLSMRHSRAFGEDDDPVSLVQPLLALLHNLSYCRMPRLAIDGNGVQLPDSPTDHRYPQQLALQDPYLARKYDGHCDRFP